MAWNDTPPTKEELNQSDWSATPPTDQELSSVAPTPEHSFLNAMSNPFGIEPVVQGGLQAAGKSIKDLVNNGTVNIEDIKKKYQEARDAEKQANDVAANANPKANLAGELAGGMALGGSGLLPEAAKGASLAAKLKNAAKIGTGFGAATGLGTSLSSGADLPTTAINTVGGGAMGALTGPALELGAAGLGSIGSLGSSVGKAVQDEVGSSKSLDNFKKAFNYGKMGINTNSKDGAQSAQQGVEDAAEALGLGARDLNKQAGAQVGAAKQALQENGNTFDISNQLAKIKTAIANLQKSNDPGANDDAAFLQKYLDNLIKGKEQEIPYSKLNAPKTVPGTLSSAEKLEAQAAAARAKGLALGKEVNTEITPVTDEETGTPFDALVKGNEDKQTASVLPQSEGTEDQLVPGSPGTATSKTVRLGGINPQAVDFNTAQDINDTLTRFGGVTDAPTPLNTNTGLNASKLTAQSLKSQLTQSVPEGAEGPASQLQNANQKATASYKALNALGVDDSSFETNPLTGEKILTPQGEAKLSNTVRQIGRGADTQAGQNASSRLNTSLDYLKSIDPDKAAQLQQQVTQAGDVSNLVQQGQGNIFGKGVTTALPVRAGNFLGRLAATPTDSIEGVVSGSAASGASKQVSTAIQPLTDQAFTAAAKQAVSTGTGPGMKLGSELAKGIGKDNTQKNAILFSLMQQPGYRDLLQKHFGNQTDTQGK